MLVTIPNQHIPFNEVGSAVHVTGVDGIILRLYKNEAKGWGDEWVGWGLWLRDDGGQTERGTFNNGSNQNNVTSNWLSVEMLFSTKAPVSSLGFHRAESYSLTKHTHWEADWEWRAEESAAVSLSSPLHPPRSPSLAPSLRCRSAHRL